MKYNLELVKKEIESSEKSLIDICKELKYPYKYISRLLKSQNYKVPLRFYKLNLSKEFILEMYNKHLEGINITELSKLYNLDFNTVKKYFKKFNLKIYKFNQNSEKVNHTFFREINSEIKAYLLGFLLGDGTLNKEGSIALLIQSQDVEVLELYKKYIYPDANFYFYKKQSEKHQDRLKIIIYSNVIKQDLILKGIPENKTENMFDNPQYCSDEFLIHLIRGFFDADGTVGKYGRTRRLKITCTNIEFLKFCEKYFNSKGIVGFRYEKPKNNKAYNLTISRTSELIKIYNLFYLNSEFYLKRKQVKFKDVALPLSN